MKSTVDDERSNIRDDQAAEDSREADCIFEEHFQRPGKSSPLSSNSFPASSAARIWSA